MQKSSTLKDKEPGKPIKEVYSNSKIVHVIKTYGELGHEHKFVTEIIVRRANDSIVSITEPDYNNFNKNDIEDMYLLCVNGKLGMESYQQKVNLTAQTITFPGIEKYKIVLEWLKSYNNDVKHGYVTPSLSKEDVEYRQLFEEEIEERLKHRDQMRRWEMYVNKRPLEEGLDDISNEGFEEIRGNSRVCEIEDELKSNSNGRKTNVDSEISMESNGVKLNENKQSNDDDYPNTGSSNVSLVPMQETVKTWIDVNTRTQFDNKQGLQNVIESGPWIVNNKPMVVQNCDPSVILDRKEPNTFPLWIKLMSPPLEAWSNVGLSSLASRIDTLLIMDVMTTRMCNQGIGSLGYARILVEANADKGLVDHIDVLYRRKDNGKQFVKKIRVEYDWKAPLCSCCKVFGHSDSKCPSISKTEEQGKNRMQDSEGLIKVGIRKENVNEGKRNVQYNNKLMEKRYGNQKFIYRQKNKKDNANAEKIKENKDNHGNYNISKQTHRKVWNVDDNVIKDVRIADVNDDETELDENDVYIDRNGTTEFMTINEVSGMSNLTQDMIDFHDCVNETELEDINSSGFHFTWTKSLLNPNATILKKIDKFKDLVKEKWDIDIQGHAMYKLVKKLKTLKPHLNKLNWKNGNLFDKVVVLKAKFHDVQCKIDKDPTNQMLKAEGVEILKIYKEAAEDEEKLNRSRIMTVCAEDGIRYNNCDVAEQFVKHFTVFLGISPTVSKLKEEDGDLFERRISQEEGNLTTCEINDEKIKKALFDIDDNKAPGPNGFTSKLYKKAWDTIKSDFYAAIKEFFISGKLLGEVNATLISLVPKSLTPLKVSDFRPIACCNVIYKCISKILTNRIKAPLSHIIDDNQSAFVPGRAITDNILLTQELLKGYNCINVPKRCSFKIDIQKAYDTVSWSFIEDILRKFRFPCKMMNWIMTCITTPKFTICVNGERYGYFKGGRGLRQGDPISLYIFTMVTEILNHIVKDEIKKNKDFKYHFRCKQMKITHLCFAEDLIMLSHDDETKSDISSIFPFKEGKLPVRYLGVLLVTKKIGVVVDKDTIQDVLDDKGWKWPYNWIVKYPWIANIQTPNLNNNPDKAVWIDNNGNERNFSLNIVWKEVRGRSGKFCKKVPNSHDHLFPKCDYAQKVWRMMIPEYSMFYMLAVRWLLQLDMEWSMFQEI
ncbi:RNA-directed DNA polymerase, eukaryota, reverse transcriptase zinc-binding domain protein [Tanacetum coccineum]